MHLLSGSIKIRNGGKRHAETRQPLLLPRKMSGCVQKRRFEQLVGSWEVEKKVDDLHTQ